MHRHNNQPRDSIRTSQHCFHFVSVWISFFLELLFHWYVIIAKIPNKSNKISEKCVCSLDFFVCKIQILILIRYRLALSVETSNVSFFFGKLERPYSPWLKKWNIANNKRILNCCLFPIVHKTVYGTHILLDLMKISW